MQHRADELASVLPALLIDAERIAATVGQGVHGRRRTGQGESFWQFRPYQWGDQATDIDWRRSARSDSHYVRETEWEAAESVWLWRDASPSMNYCSSPQVPQKSDRAALLLVALASLLVRGHERVALLGSGQLPSSSRAALIRLAAEMEQPASAPLPDFGVPRLRLSHRGELVLIGDFLSSLEDLAAVIGSYAAAGIRGHMVQVLDPAEESLPFTGRVLFKGLEQDGQALFGKVESVRPDYQKALAAHRQGLTDLAGSVGWTFSLHHTDRPPETALLALYLALSGANKGRR